MEVVDVISNHSRSRVIPHTFLIYLVSSALLLCLYFCISELLVAEVRLRPRSHYNPAALQLHRRGKVLDGPLSAEFGSNKPDDSTCHDQGCKRDTPHQSTDIALRRSKRSFEVQRVLLLLTITIQIDLPTQQRINPIHTPFPTKVSSSHKNTKKDTHHDIPSIDQPRRTRLLIPIVHRSLPRHTGYYTPPQRKTSLRLTMSRSQAAGGADRGYGWYRRRWLSRYEGRRELSVANTGMFSAPVNTCAMEGYSGRGADIISNCVF